MTWWTYIFPKTIFRTSTKFNHDIRVVEVYGKNKLLVNGSRQSGAYIEKLWKEALQVFGINSSTTVNSILILGVAGGTVIHLLRKLYPNASIRGVDIDNMMIDVGKKYFGLDKLDISFFVADAEVFIKKDKKKYDLVIVDIFSGRHIPDFVVTDDFLDKLKKLFETNGQLVVNYLRENEYQKKSDILFVKLKKRFSIVKDKEISLNRFFWGKPHFVIK